MASILKVDALQGITAAGDITITSEGGSATMQLQQGLAKAWVGFNATTTVEDSFNVSSLSDTSSGRTTINFSNNLNNSGYAPQYSANGGTDEDLGGEGPRCAVHTRTTSSFKTTMFSGAYRDNKHNGACVNGDLA